MREHVVRRYSKAENPLYCKRVKSPIPGILSALVGLVLAVYLVCLILAHCANQYVSSHMQQDNYNQIVMVKGE